MKRIRRDKNGKENKIRTKHVKKTCTTNYDTKKC